MLRRRAVSTCGGGPGGAAARGVCALAARASFISIHMALHFHFLLRLAAGRFLIASWLNPHCNCIYEGARVPFTRGGTTTNDNGTSQRPSERRFPPPLLSLYLELLSLPVVVHALRPPEVVLDLDLLSDVTEVTGEALSAEVTPVDRLIPSSTVRVVARHRCIQTRHLRSDRGIAQRIEGERGGARVKVKLTWLACHVACALPGAQS